MQKIDLIKTANALPHAWRSHIVGAVGPARLKLVRMDALQYAEEVHEYNEALVVIDGKMELLLAGRQQTVTAGELIMVAACTPHSIAAGSYGTLLIVDL